MTTIIFDCFGVICAESIRPWMLANLGGWETIKEYFAHVAKRFDLNEIDEPGVAAEFAKKVGRTPEEVQGEIDGHLIVNTALIEYIRELKGKGYKIGMISNGHHDSIERRILSITPGLPELFDSVVISSKVGMLKPDRGIYEHALAELRSVAAETIFVDDNETNVAGAREVGITGIFYTSVDALKADLKEIGI